MTDKERLEEIKRKFDLDRIRKFLDANLISSQDLIYLIQQAERVQELEKKLENVMDRHTYLEGDYYDLQKQNKRYREAIEVAIHNMTASDNLGVKFALGILEQALEESE